MKAYPVDTHLLATAARARGATEARGVEGSLGSAPAEGERRAPGERQGAASGAGGRREQHMHGPSAQPRPRPSRPRAGGRGHAERERCAAEPCDAKAGLGEARGEHGALPKSSTKAPPTGGAMETRGNPMRQVGGGGGQRRSAGMAGCEAGRAHQGRAAHQ